MLGEPALFVFFLFLVHWSLLWVMFILVYLCTYSCFPVILSYAALETLVQMLPEKRANFCLPNCVSTFLCTHSLLMERWLRTSTLIRETMP